MMKLVAFSLLLTLAITVCIAPVSCVRSSDVAINPSDRKPADGGVVVPATTKPIESPPDAIVIHIVNEFKDAKKAIRIQCETKVQDFGIHDVPAGSELQWTIKNVDKVLPYYCVVSGNDKDAVFKAYYEDADLSQRVTDNNSYFVAKEDGIYLREIPKNTDVLVVPWH